ncbi:hypothetical protein K491DRAFT_765016 [Lophiostoma macrostomum CBS 122681]|uniref:RNA polymerase II assembly factor Rtp1 C-terminal domain-containing protein n=1 Tax=Lophiostoma macrostomum CBS 122681 TaxID=1314788 RepID=A0A6A6TR66_9PLEO|nr:hypothetical protein K491DRAFT_765016 [Lophiostoma macrostomum CBS 122681]
MGADEAAVDAAADFIGPHLRAEELVNQALSHLQKINEAEQTKAPDSPYDGSLVGVVYGLLDLVTSLGLLPYLAPGVAFGQRPQSVLLASLSIAPTRNDSALAELVQNLLPIFHQDGSGVQPFVTQRILPDLLSALLELAFAPDVTSELHATFRPRYEAFLVSTPTSRLLPIFSSFLQQNVPPWLRQQNGVRSTIEFLSLSYLSKNGRVPQDASGSQSQIPIPLESITQAARLLAAVPSDMDSTMWFTELAPQLWSLLDGSAGVELSRAAGHIIAGGILNRKSVGAPGTIGWETFARPLLDAIRPGSSTITSVRQGPSDEVIVEEKDLRVALRRLSTMLAAVTHAGIVKRLVHPILLSLWALLTYAKTRPSLDARWVTFPRSILIRYNTLACDPKQMDRIATNLFCDGEALWTFGPGSHGGVEIRKRSSNDNDMDGMGGKGNLLMRIQNLDERIKLLISLLSEANVEDEVVGTIFVQTTQRWLRAGQTNTGTKISLTIGDDIDPLATLIDAKLAEALASAFQDKFARSPQHIISLMEQILQNFVQEHQEKSKKLVDSNKPSRTNLGTLVTSESEHGPSTSATDTESEDLVSFALSILSTFVNASTATSQAQTKDLYTPILPSLRYLSQPNLNPQLSPLITNASSSLLTTLQPTTIPTGNSSSHSATLSKHRKTLTSALTDLTSPDPPNRTWALSTLHTLFRDPISFALIDVPSTAHMLLHTSLSDPESYVHSAAIPVLGTLTTLAPNPTLRILLDVFTDINEDALRLRRTAHRSKDKADELEQALDSRLRVGEVLHNLILSPSFWSAAPTRYENLHAVLSTCLSISSRRGHRPTTLSTRQDISARERVDQEEAEAAWGGPIPNLLDPEGENAAELEERDALFKIVQGWQDTGVEEDVRMRASAMSLVGDVFEQRVDMLRQVDVDAGLQMASQILVVETSEVKAILRRAAVLVVMGLLRGLDAELEAGRESLAGLGVKTADEVERVVRWVRDEDGDDLVRGHAESVLEGLETWKMKKLFKLGQGQVQLDANLGLAGTLRGLDVNPVVQGAGREQRKVVVEEIE